MTLNPQEEFVVARQLNDPNDVGTYYVKALIRNAKTDVLIATLELDNKGSQRFTKTWQVPQDPTGLGFYITITSLVYTDSGYTTLSTTYGSEQYELLVQDRINPFLSVGADINYKKIREIVQEEIAKIPTTPPVDLKPLITPLAEKLDAIKSAVSSIKIPVLPDIPKVDLDPLEAKLKAIQTQIESIEIPETDLSPLSVPLEDMLLKLADIKEALSELDKEKVPEKVQTILDEFLEHLMNLDILLTEPEPEVIDKKKKSMELLKEYLNEH